MLQYNQCKIFYEQDGLEPLKNKVAKELHMETHQLQDFAIIKKSVDARKKPEVYYTYSVIFSCENEANLLKRNKKNRNLMPYAGEPDLYEQIKKFSPGDDKEPIVIIGTGPAGLFCGYLLAKCGYRPLMIERGGAMSERVEKVSRFWEEGTLDIKTNVSFGEGGAGTFSDGKLNTGVKDKTGRKQFVLKTFIHHGAPEEIGYVAKPHIGTDCLRDVMVSMRQQIEAWGGDYRFQTRFKEFLYDESQGKRIRGIVVENENGQEEEILCKRVVLAIGHSARDTFEGLKQQLAMESKAFAVGVRVAHPQSMMNESQYGVDTKQLPAADYKVTGKTSDNRGVYSFCMCPGGYVVNASSEQGMTVVNGMSNHGRDSRMANSAIVVTVDKKDFGSHDVLAGMEFQRQLEKMAYEEGKGAIPAQRYGDFVLGISTKTCPEDLCTKGNFVPGNVKKILPSYIANGIIEGIEQFGRRIQGFDSADTWIFGTETRTSSPVRILRDESFQSVNVKGVYPCGEGAGYAGGIMSAAMDGLRVATQILSERKEKEHEK